MDNSCISCSAYLISPRRQRSLPCALLRTLQCSQALCSIISPTCAAAALSRRSVGLMAGLPSIAPGSSAFSFKGAGQPSPAPARSASIARSSYGATRLADTEQRSLSARFTEEQRSYGAGADIGGAASVADDEAAATVSLQPSPDVGSGPSPRRASASPLRVRLDLGEHVDDDATAKHRTSAAATPLSAAPSKSAPAAARPPWSTPSRNPSASPIRARQSYGATLSRSSSRAVSASGEEPVPLASHRSRSLSGGGSLAVPPAMSPPSKASQQDHLSAYLGVLRALKLGGPPNLAQAEAQLEFLYAAALASQAVGRRTWWSTSHHELHTLPTHKRCPLSQCAHAQRACKGERGCAERRNQGFHGIESRVVRALWVGIVDRALTLPLPDHAHPPAEQRHACECGCGACRGA